MKEVGVAGRKLLATTGGNDRDLLCNELVGEQQAHQ